MRDLNVVLAALQAELARALAAGTKLPDGTQLAADRVTVSLAFAVAEPAGKNSKDGVRFVVPTDKAGSKAAAPHQLTVELRMVDGRLVGASPATATATAAPVTAVSLSRVESIPDSDAARLVQIFSGIFGAPGFDSSARATVFREALEELTGEQARAVIESLNGGTASEEPALKRAQHLLKRVLQSGPGGVVTGAQKLETLFRQYPVGALVSFVEARWKTQEDWMK